MAADLNDRGVVTSGSGARWRRLRRLLIPALALSVAVVGAGIAVITSRPTDVQAVEPSEPTVWLANGTTGAAMYGRVNTKIMELDTALPTLASFPTSILQHGSQVVLVAGSKYLAVDPARPVEIDEDTALGSLPGTIRTVASAGAFAALLDDSGQVFAASLGDIAAGAFGAAINKTSDDEPEPVTESFVAVAVTAAGIVYALGSDGALVTYDIRSAAETSRSQLNTVVPAGSVATGSFDLTVFGGRWAVLHRAADSAPASLWIDGVATAQTLDTSARLAAPSDSPVLYVATSTALTSYQPDGSAGPVAVTVTGGRPAEPVVGEDGCVQAAWANAGTVETSSCGAGPVTHADDAAATDQSTLTLRTGGGSPVLNNSSTGAAWVWQGQNWEFVPSSARWNEVDSSTQIDPTQQSEPVKDNRCPVPATGDDSEFGLRGDSLSRVPVLIAARDANVGDVLSIVPGSVAWKGPELGALTIIDDGQALAVAVAGTPTEGSSVEFQITDGTCVQPATASVRVHPAQENAKPEQRGEAWSAGDLTLDPKAALTVDALRGWVDPDGDPIVLTTEPATVGTAVATPTGDVVYRPEPAQASGSAKVSYAVTDPGGLSAAGALTYTVSSGAGLQVTAFATTGVVGRSQIVSVAPHVSGSAGALKVTDVPDVAGLTITQRSDGTSFAISAEQPGSYTIDYEVTSGKVSGRGKIRYEAVTPESATLSTAPITVYLFAGDDVSVDPFTAVRNPAGEALALTEVSVDPVADQSTRSISVTSVAGRSLRVSAQGPDGETGVAGTFSYTITGQTAADEGQTVSGRGTVYVIADQGQQEAVARDDYAVVRAGSTIDLEVLANDVAPAGTSLVLDPRDRHDDDLTEGLGFPSGSVLRFLAPATAGLVPVTYSIYTRGHPDAVSQATAYFMVSAPEANGAPQSQALNGAVFSGGYVDLAVPRYNTDPDGDEVFATEVQQPAAGGEVQILDDGATLRVTALGSHTGQAIVFSYTISDGKASDQAEAQVAVIDGEPAPVAFNDYGFGAAGSTVSLDPTLNDTIPPGQVATLTVDRVDTTAQGVVRTPVAVPAGATSLSLTVADTPTVYEYTLETSLAADSAATTTAGGSTQSRVIGTSSARIRVVATASSVPTFPRVTDTVVSAADVVDDAFDVNVIDGKVAWAGGALALALVGTPAGAAASDETTVSGTLSDTSQVLPFSVSGAPATTGGVDVISYGFVRVPAESSFRPVRSDSTKIFTATEGDPAGVAIDLASEVTAFQGRHVEIVAEPHTDGLRPQATCRTSGNGTLVYVAGDGTETRDGCSVTVQWTGVPASRTVLRFGIKISLLNPPPQISSGVTVLSLTPKETGTYSLAKLVSWERKTQADIAGLQFQCVAAASTQLAVDCHNGSTLTVTAQQTARQGGNPDAVTVTIVGPETFDPAITATVLVQVTQPPPVTLNVPAITRELQASAEQDRPATVRISVLDEIQPVIDTYYGWHSGTINSVDCAAPVECSVAGPDQIDVSIPAEVGAKPTPGGTFRGSYTFQDSTDPSFRANRGTGELVFEYSAIPQTPTITLKSYTESEVVFSASAPQATPQVSKVVVTGSGGLQASCVPTGGSCTVELSGLTANEKHTFTAVSRNSVGDSSPSEAVEAWAYRAPSRPTVTWVPVANGKTGEKAKLFVTATGVNTGSITVTGPDGDQNKQVGSDGKATFEVTGVSNTGTTVVVTANSDTQRPDSDTVRDTASTEVSVNGVGAPDIVKVEQVTGERSAVATLKGNGSGSSVAVGWGWGDSCSVSTVVSVSGTVSLTSPTFSAEDLPQNTKRKVRFCAESRVASMSGMAGIDAGITGLDSGDAFGRATESATLLMIEAPSEAAVQSKVRYDVEGSADGGFSVVLPSSATWGDVTFSIERDGSADPTRSNQKVDITLRKDGTEIGSYSVGPKRTDRRYVPGELDTHGFEGRDFAGCIFNDTGTGTATSSFTFEAPTFAAEVPDDSDWTWSIQGTGAIDNLDYTAADGATKNWSPASLFTAGGVRLTVEFEGQLAGLTGYSTALNDITCAAPD